MTSTALPPEGLTQERLAFLAEWIADPRTRDQVSPRIVERFDGLLATISERDAALAAVVERLHILHEEIRIADISRSLRNAFLRSIKNGLANLPAATKAHLEMVRKLERERELYKTLADQRMARLTEWEPIVETATTAESERDALAAKSERLVNLLTHIHHEVAVLEDFDAGSLMKEIEQAISGEKTFDDNKALHAQIAALMQSPREKAQ